MSLTISTDVFCDGDACSQWVEGVTGPRSNAKDARQQALRFGWSISRAGDFCPKCAKAVRTHSTGEGEGGVA
jgi:hypothetical protein